MAITLDEMKKYLRVDFTDDDALIELVRLREAGILKD